MTPRRSPYADVRRRLRAAAPSPIACPLPAPPPQAGEGTEKVPPQENGRSRPSSTGRAGKGTERAFLPPSPTKLQQTAPSLTDTVRALYEDSAVPVVEIARLAGVNQRTLYRYVARGGWKRRYASRGEAAAAANRGRKRGRRPPQPRGAGGRFVARAERDRPHRSGLKALDPDGAQQAVAACEHWGVLATQAMERAVAQRDADRQARIVALVTRVMRDIAAIVARRDRTARRKGAAAAASKRPRRRLSRWRPFGTPPSWTERR